VWYAARRLTHCADSRITSCSLPSPFTGAQVGLVVTQRADARNDPVTHDVPLPALVALKISQDAIAIVDCNLPPRRDYVPCFTETLHATQ
jgi:hypothetical protein